jgi:hypothetical protein
MAAGVQTQDVSVESSRHPAGASNASSCVFDFERGEIPECVRGSAIGELVIVPQVLKELRFESHGLASVWSRKLGWMYVDRKGKVVIGGVPSIDSGPDSFHDGLVRIVKNGKYGFANRRGKIVVAAIYDGALNFDRGRATVCKGCRSKCAEPDCEHHFFAGGEWLQINTTGAILGRATPEH